MKRLLGILVAVGLAATAQAKNKHAGVTMDTPNGTVHIGMSIPDDDDDAPQAELRGPQYQPPAPPPGGRWVENTPDHRLVVSPDRNGRTLLKVVAPEGAVLHLFDQGQEIYADELPTAVETQPHRWYQVQVVFPDGSSWNNSMKTKRAMDTKLWVVAPMPAPTGPVVVTTQQQPPPPPPAPPGPMAIAQERFTNLMRAISNESFPAQKLSVLKTAAGREFFTCDQVAQLVDLYDFPHDKVEAVRMTRPHILDPENGYNLSAHFDFPADKQSVQQLFQ
jgi:hypothetical protein